MRQTYLILKALAIAANMATTGGETDDTEAEGNGSDNKLSKED